MSEEATAAKKAFALRLKGLMKDAGLNGQRIADENGWHKSKISRILSGTTNPSEDDIRAIAITCGAARQIPELIAVHREIEQMWVEHRRELRAGQRRVQASAKDLYEKTRLLRVYESFVFPGIIQTVGYATAVMEINAVLFDLPTDGDVHAAAEARVAKQYLLTEGRNRYGFLVEAWVLDSWIGEPEVMLEQLEFLTAVMRLPNVTLGIIPQSRHRAIYPGESFYIFDENLVRNGLWSGSVRTRRSEEIAYYLKVWRMLHDQAVYGDDAEALLTQARIRVQLGATS